MLAWWVAVSRQSKKVLGLGSNCVGFECYACSCFVFYLLLSELHLAFHSVSLIP